MNIESNFINPNHSSTTMFSGGCITAHSMALFGGGFVDGEPSLLGFKEHLPEILLLVSILSSRIRFSTCNPINSIIYFVQ